MSDLVERMAKAVAEKHGYPDCWEAYMPDMRCALEALGGERVCLEWLSNSDAAIWRGMGDENYLLIPLGESDVVES